MRIKLFFWVEFSRMRKNKMLQILVQKEPSEELQGDSEEMLLCLNLSPHIDPLDKSANAQMEYYN